MTFKLLTYIGENKAPRAGLLVEGEKIIDVQAMLVAKKVEIRGMSPISVLSLLDNWGDAHPVLRDISEGYTGPSSAIVGTLSDTRLAAPILFPSTIYCAAANYVDHAKEMSHSAMPDKRTARPYFFTKVPRQTVIGPGEAIRIPSREAKVDWEAEIGVVIGQKCRNAAPSDAMKYVAGFTIFNDVSNRAGLIRDDWVFRPDWFGGKSFDTSAPMGSWITPAASISDPHNLTIKLWVNDELMQNSSSQDMYFTIPEQIEYLSRFLTLLPGDVIATGTPAGVGHPRGLYLKPGDIVKITIEGLGSLTNPGVAGY